MMNTQQGLDSLLREVETILGTDLAPQRRLYFEGARDYLVTLKRMVEEGGGAKRPSRPKPAGKRAGESEDSKA